ncbi:hypothetical protein GCM10015535_36890 [Streptomyces gelaticus]|uniref:WD40 repeat domain-containing protein n=1 Tax=Streptomyces gelaticus TaxID=285446 RepID=A0ABQ2W205_9ACTN|nr:hypothetical protein GCM10015535_36890 [Streptomyces gelaticus]
MQVIVVSVGRWLRLTGPATGRRIGPLLSSRTRPVTTVATAVTDGRPVAVSGSDDGTVRVWDLTTHRQTGPALTFPAPVGLARGGSSWSCSWPCVRIDGAGVRMRPGRFHTVPHRGMRHGREGGNLRGQAGLGGPGRVVVRLAGCCRR